ncbi:MAG: aminotransferase class I/II-fold pyridoxal phosphate-dependent enzyme [Proteobacteria bacterium]|nr:aminotransferase class I/II-fold pyridoxal phosphate-dependent enzyme [Pseudomonadota bacterium]
MTRKLPRRGVHRPRGALRALVAGTLAPAGRVDAFEAAAAQAFGAGGAAATGSGRDGLRLLLEALDLTDGDEIILPALTFGAVPQTIAALGLVPVFVDVDPATLQLDPAAAEAAVGPRTRAVLATHLCGLLADVDRLGALCDARGLRLLEDFAQAAGARRHGRAAGSFGTAGFTSLETVKPLPAFGGGLVLCRDPALADRIRRAARARPAPDPRKLLRKAALGHVEAALADPRVFTAAWPLFGGTGSEDRVAMYKARKKGAGNHGARLHPAQAAVGLRGLRGLRDHLRMRRGHAEALRGLLEDRWTPCPEPDDEPAWYQLLARAEDPVGLQEAAAEAGVDVGRDVVEDLSEGRCPTAARLARELVQLPAHPALTRPDLERVARVTRPWLAPG